MKNRIEAIIETCSDLTYKKLVKRTELMPREELVKKYSSIFPHKQHMARTKFTTQQLAEGVVKNQLSKMYVLKHPEKELDVRIGFISPQEMLEAIVNS